MTIHRRSVILTNMTSKERFLGALTCREVDHIPCSIYFNSNLLVEGYDLTSAEGRIRLQMDLGGDPVAHLSIGNRQHAEVQTRTWLQDVPDRKHPVLYKEYETPAGKLRHGVDYTPAWPSGEEIPWDDFRACDEITVAT